MLMGLLCCPAGDPSAITHLRMQKVHENAPPSRRAAAAASRVFDVPKNKTETPEEIALIANRALRPAPASLTRPQNIDVQNCANEEQAASTPVAHPTADSDGGGGGGELAFLSSPPLSMERTR